jgi:hypothetical protein
LAAEERDLTWIGVVYPHSFVERNTRTAAILNTLRWKEIEANPEYRLAPSDYYLIAELDLPPETTKDNPEAKSVRSKTHHVEIKRVER